MASTGEPVSPTTEDTKDDMKKTVDIVVQTWALVNQNALKHGIIFYKR